MTWGADAAGTYELAPCRGDVTELAPPRSRLRDDADAHRYVRVTLALTIAIYALLAAAMAGIVPAALPGHRAAVHLRAAVPRAARTPACAARGARAVVPSAGDGLRHASSGWGIAELRSIHFRHHRHAATARDPELYQIRGGHFRALCNAMISPERAMATWVRARGVRRSLLRDGAIRRVLFRILTAVNPAVFLPYWCALRVGVGPPSFVFHHLLHDRAGEPGTFALPLPAWLVRAGATLFGDEPMLILTRHRSHRLWPDRVRDRPTCRRASAAAGTGDDRDICRRGAPRAAAAPAMKCPTAARSMRQAPSTVRNAECRWRGAMRRMRGRVRGGGALSVITAARSGRARPRQPGTASVVVARRRACAFERRQLTLMFCDLVGSVQLSHAAGPEDLRDVIAAYRDACEHRRQAVRGHDRAVQGDGILVYFGYPVAHEDDARRSVEAGLEILQSCARARPPGACRAGHLTFRCASLCIRA